jgi:hypothetical protein
MGLRLWVDGEVPDSVATITLADSLWRDVQAYAVKKGLKLTQVVESALKAYLEEESKKEKTE